MLNSIEHEIISTAHKTKMLNKDFSCFQALSCCIDYPIMLINVKMPQLLVFNVYYHDNFPAQLS